MNQFLPEHKQERRTCFVGCWELLQFPENWVGGKAVLGREKARKRTVLETAIAVASTKPCELNTEDMVGQVKPDQKRQSEDYLKLRLIHCTVGPVYIIYKGWVGFRRKRMNDNKRTEIRFRKCKWENRII